MINDRDYLGVIIFLGGGGVPNILGCHKFLERKIGGHTLFDNHNVGNHNVFILFKKTDFNRVGSCRIFVTEIRGSQFYWRGRLFVNLGPLCTKKIITLLQLEYLTVYFDIGLFETWFEITIMHIIFFQTLLTCYIWQHTIMSTIAEKSAPFYNCIGLLYICFVRKTTITKPQHPGKQVKKW